MVPGYPGKTHPTDHGGGGAGQAGDRSPLDQTTSPRDAPDPGTFGLGSYPPLAVLKTALVPVALGKRGFLCFFGLEKHILLYLPAGSGGNMLCFALGSYPSFSTHFDNEIS